MATPARYDDNPEPAETTNDTGAADFDLAKWVAGVLPVTHTVTIYQRGDLVGDLDVVKMRLAQARLSRDKDAIAALEDQAAQIVEALEGSSLEVKVEGWSQDRIDAFIEPLKVAGMSDEDRVIEQVAAQVTEPAGFTADQYRTLLERVRPQAETIAGAVLAANTRVPVVSIPS